VVVTIPRTNAITPGTQPGTFNVTVELTPAAKQVHDDISVKVTIGGIDCGIVTLRTRKGVQFKGLKLPPNEDAEVIVENIADDTLVSRTTIKAEAFGAEKEKKAALATLSAFEVRVGRCTVDGFNPITVITRDKDGNPASCKVIIKTGQACRTRTATFPDGELQVETDRTSGTVDLSIQLAEKHHTAQFDDGRGNYCEELLLKKGTYATS
jgi:hypothetical protein